MRCDTRPLPPAFLRSDRGRPRLRAGTLVACLAVALAAAAPAQRAAVFKGRVLDPGGKGVEGATVSVTNDNDSTIVVTAVTDRKGRFEIPILIAGPYTVSVESEHAPYTNHMDVVQGMEYPHDIKLRDLAGWRQERSVQAFNDGVRALQGGQLEDAERLLKEAQELNPELVPTHQALAALYHSQDRWEEAAAEMDAFWAAQPDDTQMAPVAFDAYFESGQQAKAEAAYAKISDPTLRSEAATRVYNSGVRAFQQDDTDGAVALFSKAVEMNPSFAKARQNLAAIEFNRQSWKAAAEHIDVLLQLDPANAEGRRLRYFCYRNLNDPRVGDALAGYLETATPDQVEELVDLAAQDFDQGRADAAQSQLEAIVAAKPSVAEAHYALGRVLASQGRNEEAKQHLQHFLDMAPDHPEAATAKAMMAEL